MASVLYDGLIGAVIGTVIGVRKWRHAAAVKKLIEADELAEQAREDARLAPETQYAEAHRDATPNVSVELGARNPENTSYVLLFSCERAVVAGSITLMPGYDPGVISGLAPYGGNTLGPTVSLSAVQPGETIRTALWTAGPELVAGQTLDLRCDITVASGHSHQFVREITFPPTGPLAGSG